MKRLDIDTAVNVLRLVGIAESNIERLGDEANALRVAHFILAAHYTGMGLALEYPEKARDEIVAIFGVLQTFDAEQGSILRGGDDEKGN